jgi:transcriptional antiterminator RfaH
MLKANENPPIAPPGIDSVARLEGDWWVAHTRARFEKAFAWDMLHRGVGYFLPMVERVRVSGGRKRRVLMPLFTSYVFFCGSELDRHNAMATGRLCQTIPVPDKAKFVAEIAAIEKALTGGAVLDPYPHAAVGMRCRVSAGPFLGMEGVVLQRGKLARLVLEISILGQGALVEIDADLLEPAE